MRRLFFVIIFLLTACGGGSSSGGHTHNEPEPSNGTPVTAQAFNGADCLDGLAGNFPCFNISLSAGLTFSEQAADIWGWTDTVNAEHYALLTLTTGTAFIRVSDPTAPQFIAFLPSATTSSSWHDIKVIDHFALIVSEANNHGLQIFDLTRLATLNELQTVTADVHYTEFGDAHNIAVNEDTGFAYVVGSNTCAGGLHMIDLNDPLAPAFAGCFSADGYTHDTQCTDYWGDDGNYRGHEICFSANEDTLTITDVTDKNAPFLIAKVGYPNVGYTHQGWLSEDHNYFILGDELDEQRFGLPTRTLIFDVRSLSTPTFVASHAGTTAAIDHNLYTKDHHVYQANYTAGVRILRIGNLALGELAEVAYFDTWPTSNSATFDGVWSVYPYFDSGIIVTANINGQFFVLEPNLAAIPECSDGLDNDSDGSTDFPADASCNNSASAYEQ